MHKVFTARVSPVHIPPYVAVRVVLVINMIISVVIHKTVRVVVPVRILRKMVLLAVSFGVVRVIACRGIHVAENNLGVEAVEARSSARISQSVRKRIKVGFYVGARFVEGEAADVVGVELAVNRARFRSNYYFYIYFFYLGNIGVDHRLFALGHLIVADKVIFL